MVSTIGVVIPFTISTAGLTIPVASIGGASTIGGVSLFLTRLIPSIILTADSSSPIASVVLTLVISTIGVVPYTAFFMLAIKLVTDLLLLGLFSLFNSVNNICFLTYPVSPASRFCIIVLVLMKFKNPDSTSLSNVGYFVCAISIAVLSNAFSNDSFMFLSSLM